MAAPSKTWNIKNYVLAALAGTLAATAIVIIVSAILSPARISFVLTHASRSNLTHSTGVCLNLTISANTSSQHRTKVKYESIFIDLMNGTTRTGMDKFHAQVDRAALPTWYLQSPSNTSIKASALLIENATIESFAGSQANNTGLTVVVMAQVHFRVGVVRTRLYGIKVYCDSVHFDDYPATALSVSCHS